MNLLWAELRKVWAGRLFPLMLAVLAAGNLLLLWLGTRPADGQPPAAAYRAVGEELAGLDTAEKGAFLHQKLADAQALYSIDQYYRGLAWGDTYQKAWREKNRALFDRYDALYTGKGYTLYTGDIYTDGCLLRELTEEFDTVAGYEDFLAEVQENAARLAGISIFQRGRNGYDLKNIAMTARVYAGLQSVRIEYYPQKGLNTALSCPFTDLLGLAAMLLLALLLVRQERDSGLLALVRSMPGGRLKTALAKLAAFAAGMLAVLAVLYGVNLAWCGASYGLGPLGRTIQSVPALMRCTMQITVGQYLLRFLLAKWAAAVVMGLWVMLAALLARHTVAGWLAALAMPLGMYGVRAAIPATSHLNVLKYANLASLMQTNELLGAYRNLYWFGEPVALPLVEWLAAALFGAGLAAAFCAVFARAPLRAAPARRLPLRRGRRTCATTVPAAEARKLLWSGGAGLVLAALVAFGAWQAVHTRTWQSAEEIYLAGYMQNIAGPWRAQSRIWLQEQGQEFFELHATQKKVRAGQLPGEALYRFGGLELKDQVYRDLLQHIRGYIGAHPKAWLLYDAGYRWLFALDGGRERDIQDALLAGLACALCFSGLFAMERRTGMEALLLTTPLGRRRTARAKLGWAAALAVCIALAGCLPHLWVALRAHGLPQPWAPALSMTEYSALPAPVTLSDVLLFWVLCRAAACVGMAAFTLWLGRRCGALPALFLSAAAYGLPPLLALSGMENGIEWLGAYPLFHAAALLADRGVGRAWIPLVLAAAALVLAAALGQSLLYAYEWAGRE